MNETNLIDQSLSELAKGMDNSGPLFSGKKSGPSDATVKASLEDLQMNEKKKEIYRAALSQVSMFSILNNKKLMPTNDRYSH